MPPASAQPAGDAHDWSIVDLDRLRPDTRPLSIYLNDHLMGATAGVELARRIAKAAYPEHRPALEWLAAEIAEDRATLIEQMRQLGVPARTYRMAAGWLGEKAGRLKPNGHVVHRAPLSQLIEIEAMLLGVTGKRAGWQALRAIAGAHDALSADRLDLLIRRAEDQAGQLESVRAELAGRVLTL